LLDGLFDVFGGGHDRDIAFRRGAEKGGGRNSKRVRPIHPWLIGGIRCAIPPYELHGRRAIRDSA
jgi:hypothetical protein